jgi:hypothetical protein
MFRWLIFVFSIWFPKACKCIRYNVKSILPFAALILHFKSLTGRFANKQLKNHFRAYELMQLDAHFEERDLKFKQMELDPVTGKPFSLISLHSHVFELLT